MKTAGEKLCDKARALPRLVRNAFGGNDRRGPTKAQCDGAIQIRFVEEPRWESPVRTGAAPSSINPNRREIALLKYSVIAAPETADALTRKIAWAMQRACAVAECLGAV